MYIPCLGETLLIFLLDVNKEACTLISIGDHFVTRRETALEGSRTEKQEQGSLMPSLNLLITVPGVCFDCGLPVM